MRNERKHYTADEKVAILRRHLLDKVPVPDLCEELGLRPTVFYRWQKEFFENGSAAFQSRERPGKRNFPNPSAADEMSLVAWEIVDNSDGWLWIRVKKLGRLPQEGNGCTTLAADSIATVVSPVSLAAKLSRPSSISWYPCQKHSSD